MLQSCPTKTTQLCVHACIHSVKQWLLDNQTRCHAPDQWSCHVFYRCPRVVWCSLRLKRLPSLPPAKVLVCVWRLVVPRSVAGYVAVFLFLLIVLMSPVPCTLCELLSMLVRELCCVFSLCGRGDTHKIVIQNYDIQKSMIIFCCFYFLLFWCLS